MVDLLDAMSELVYVVDIDTYELLYMNASGKDIFGLDSIEGRLCYETLQGYSAPCPFCTTPLLERNGYYTWERTNPLNGRHYLLRDRLVDWPGKHARIQIAFDLTEKQETLEKETLLVDCVEALQLGGPFRASSGVVLRSLAEYAGAERACILEAEGARVIHVYEWRRDGLPERSGELRGADLSAKNWKGVFRDGVRVLCYPNDRDTQNEKRHTVLLLVNPSAAREEKLPPILKTLAVFTNSVLQKERYQRELERLSYVDSLTGVYNHNAYLRDVRRPVRQPVGIVHVSLNGLKEINDRCGREQGNQALTKMARLMRDCFGKAELYRTGGDEFIALWMAAVPAEFEAGVRRLKEWRGGHTDIQFALGYQWSERSTDLQELGAQAEERMYQDKKDFYRGVLIPKRYRPSLDQALRLGGEENLEQLLREGRFPVYFQPKFSVRDRSVIGAEALVRFISDAGDVLAPAHFVPFLEEARVINHVDFHVFDFVCAKILQWRKEGKRVAPVSVNFSRYSIMEPWFHDTLLKSWERYRIPKEDVEIEITESAEENDSESLLQILTRLQNDGFSVSIDDFGVKYANLSLITSASFSTLKIDKSLLDDWKNPRTKELLRMLCNVCRSTGLHLIAEGVETEEQLGFLQEIDCEGVQGFLLSRPIPLDEYEKRYVNGRMGL